MDNDARNDLREQVLHCCKILDERKAEEIRIIHFGPSSSIADYFIVATGTSEPHLRALRNYVEEALDEMKVPILGSEADSQSGWMVLDAYDFMLHLFTQEQRERYRLEHLWKDADQFGWERLEEERAPLVESTRD